MFTPERLAEQFEAHRRIDRRSSVHPRRGGPEADAVLADSVGLALLVVLEKLDLAERLAFVLHDVFAMAFEEIAPLVDRSVVATRQLASRARPHLR